MLPSFLLALREGLEAALIVGIVLSALRKMQRTKSAAAIWTGVAAAVVVSGAAAVALTLLGYELKDPAEAVFEGLTMLLAAGILTWMIFWMSRQSQGMRANLEAGVQKAAGGGRRTTRTPAHRPPAAGSAQARSRRPQTACRARRRRQRPPRAQRQGSARPGFSKLDAGRSVSGGGLKTEN